MGRDGFHHFLTLSQHDYPIDVPMEQWALAVVSYSLYTYRIEVESNFKTASRVHVSADCSWSHESDCRQQTHIIVFGCPHDHLVLLELIR